MKLKIYIEEIESEIKAKISELVSIKSPLKNLVRTNTLETVQEETDKIIKLEVVHS